MSAARSRATVTATCRTTTHDGTTAIATAIALPN
jgi:hypothetical protein